MRYSDPVKIRIEGDQEAGSSYIPLARTFLGQVHATYVEAYVPISGKYSDSYTSANRPQPTEFVARKLTLPNGVNIRVQYNTWMPMIVIEVPPGADRVERLEHRGLLRALQDADEPCEPLVPPTGEPGDENYNPGKFSELHPLHVPTDTEQQWLEYPDEGLSVEFNPYDNHPLPPRGGTFVMDMIGAPFDQRAFNVRGKPPLTNCKMLVTGGGGTVTEESPYDADTYEPVGWDDVWVCPPRKFRIGRMDDMPGWPWVDTRNPEKPITRLVSISAEMVNDWVDPAAYIHIEFLKLNGEPFEADADGYLEPIELEIINNDYDWDDQNIYIFDVYMFWYDFHVTSLTRRGNKAVVGFNQLGSYWYNGVALDFLVLNLEADDAASLAQFMSCYDNAVYDTTDETTSRTGDAGQMYRVVRDEAYERTNTHDATCKWHRAKVIEYTPAVGDEPEAVFTASGTHLHEWVTYLRFNADEALVQTYAKGYLIGVFTRTQELTIHEQGEDGYQNIEFPEYLVGIDNWASGVTYDQYDVVRNGGGGVWVAEAAHLSTSTNRPRLAFSGCANHASSQWRLAWGVCGGTCGLGPGVLDAGGSNADVEVGDIYYISSGPGAGTIWVKTSIDTDKFVWEKNTVPDTQEFFIQKHTIGSSLANSVYFDFYDVVLEDDLRRAAEAHVYLWSIEYEYTLNSDFLRYISLPAITCVSPGYRLWISSTSSWRNVFWSIDKTVSTNNHAVSAYDTVTKQAFSATPTTYTIGEDSEDSLLCGWPELYNSGLLRTTTDQETSIFYQANKWPGTGIQGGAYISGDEFLIRDMAIHTFPVDGVGMAFTFGGAQSSRKDYTPAACGTNRSSGARNWREFNVWTIPSFNVVIDEHILPVVPNPVNIKYDEFPAAADPAPFAPNGANTGPLLKPVVGPEKGILCARQQLSYVGWLYPQEIVADDN